MLLLGRAGGAHHLLDLFSHFTPYCVAALAISVPLLLLIKHYKTALLALPVLVWGVVLLATSELAGGAHAEAPATDGARLRLLTVNLHTDNRDFGRMLNYLGSRDADVVVALEMDAGWYDALRRGLPEHRHYAGEARDDNFGIGVFSRLPLHDARLVDLGARVPSVIASLRPGSDRAALTLIATHPLPPLGELLFDARNRQLLALARLLKTKPGPAVVAGDLNVTPWSPWFRLLLRRTGLADSRVGFGLHATWPARFVPLGIPIDHILVRGVGVSARGVGPELGSDHRPVWADLSGF